MMSALRTLGGVQPGRCRAHARDALGTRPRRRAIPTERGARRLLDRAAAPPADGDEQVLVRGAVWCAFAASGRPAERDAPRSRAARARWPRAARARRRTRAATCSISCAPMASSRRRAAAVALLSRRPPASSLEALLFRSLIDLGAHLPLVGQRLAAMAAIVGLSGSCSRSSCRSPRARSASADGSRPVCASRFLEKIPRLADRYFQSRPSSDMAERAHAAHQIRELPTLGAQLARSTFELLLTTRRHRAACIRESAPWRSRPRVAALAIPALAQPWLRERDLRQRTHTGALDAFLSRRVPRARAGARARRRAGARARAGKPARRVGAGRARRSCEPQSRRAASTDHGFGLAAWLLFARARAGRRRGRRAAARVLGAEHSDRSARSIAQIAWQYPTQRNLTLRLLEPLGALEEEDRRQGRPRPAPSLPPDGGVPASRCATVTVRAGGHTILEEPPRWTSSRARTSRSSARPARGSRRSSDSCSAGTGPRSGDLLGGRRAARRRAPRRAAPRAPPGSIPRSSSGTDRSPTTSTFGQDGRSRDLLARMRGGRGPPAPRRAAARRPADAARRRRRARLRRRGTARAVRPRRSDARRPGSRSSTSRSADSSASSARRCCAARATAGATRRCSASRTTSARHRSFDRVLVIAGGRIVEEASPGRARGAIRTRSIDHCSTPRPALQRRLWADPSWRTLRLDGGRILEEPARERVSV